MKLCEDLKSYCYKSFYPPHCNHTKKPYAFQMLNSVWIYEQEKSELAVRVVCRGGQWSCFKIPDMTFHSRPVHARRQRP